MEAGAWRDGGHLPAGVEIDGDVDARPDVLAEESGDAVGDAAQCRLFPRAVDEGAVEVHTVVKHAGACAAAKGGRIQYRNQDDAPDDTVGIDLAQQVLERNRAFVLVAVV